MKLVRRVPRTSPLHMDLQCFPWCSILVTCRRGEMLAPGDGEAGIEGAQFTCPGKCLTAFFGTGTAKLEVRQHQVCPHCWHNRFMAKEQQLCPT